MSDSDEETDNPMSDHEDGPDLEFCDHEPHRKKTSGKHRDRERDRDRSSRKKGQKTR